MQVIKKGSKQKTFVRNGLKDVQARIRKGEKGLVIFAGDVTPIEVTRMNEFQYEDANMHNHYHDHDQGL